MKRTMLIILTVCVLAALNFAIYQKERILKEGETVYLELAPVDPRSMLQGDYMRLSFNLEGRISHEAGRSGPKRGQVVVTLDENSVARFVRLHQGESLQPGEKLIPYSADGSFITIQPNAFFFQEGERAEFQRARYGRFAFGGNGERILVGLAAEDRTMLPAKANP